MQKPVRPQGFNTNSRGRNQQTTAEGRAFFVSPPQAQSSNSLIEGTFLVFILGLEFYLIPVLHYHSYQMHLSLFLV